MILFLKMLLISLGEYTKTKDDFTLLQQWWDVGKRQLKHLGQQDTLNVKETEPGQ